jgi:quinol-cytochrome oxidoreductase complex cytochrome b subunit
MVKKEKRIYPDYIFSQLMLVFFFFGVLTTLAILLPMGLGDAADPLSTPEVIKPEWYFLAAFQLIRYFPESLGAGLVLIGLILLFVFPFIGRRVAALPHGRGWLRGIGLFFVAGYLILTALGWLSETTRTIFGTTYRFDYYGIPHRIRVSEADLPGSASDAGADTSRIAKPSEDSIEP